MLKENYSGTDDYDIGYAKADDYDIDGFASDDFMEDDSQTDSPKTDYPRKKGAPVTKIIRNATVTSVFLISGFLIILLAYSHFFIAGGRNFSGEWTANLDMTQQAAVNAIDWLQDIEGVSVSLEDLALSTQELTIQVELDMEQTARFKGTFHCHILPESYEACNQAAYEALAMSFRELLGERLRMSGYEGDIGQEAVEALVEETFGMSTVSYLMAYGPALLPSLEELQDRYDGSGTYEVTEDVFIRQFDADEETVSREEAYLRKDGNLVLTKKADSAASGSFFAQYPVIYTLNR
ncbi:MAG: hypothetical protein NC094_06270 [Bacteroidales bacterium]|nr:hypothetical protein [Lachnoclostridium sp.]MCM1383344.1 hypothetical protein [Lachnoclostridium sp.]MCM1465009.1 hypothetical protein [Bacteroidales bacterium]